MAECVIKQCTCKQSPGTTGGADYQDDTYGKGNRVHNVVKSKTGSEVATCTVCGTKR